MSLIIAVRVRIYVLCVVGIFRVITSNSGK